MIVRDLAGQAPWLVPDVFHVGLRKTGTTYLQKKLLPLLADRAVYVKNMERLSLDKPACGEDEMQLVFLEPKHWREADALRECNVTVIGTLFYSPTGYYSADMAVTDAMVAPDVSCKPFPVKYDPSLAPRKANITIFVAEIAVDYRNKGRVRVRVWENEQRKSELTPWQPYVHYMLTGSQDVMWFGCADGFEITRINQKPKPKDGWFHDEPNLAGTVLPSETLNTVSFACARQTEDTVKR